MRTSQIGTFFTFTPPTEETVRVGAGFIVGGNGGAIGMPFRVVGGGTVATCGGGGGRSTSSSRKFIERLMSSGRSLALLLLSVSSAAISAASF